MPGADASILRLMALIVATFGLFALWPGIDLWVSGLFYDSVQGFWVDRLALPDALRRTIWAASGAMILIAAAALAGDALRGRAAFGVPARVWTFILLLYALGPGLLVDGILKRYWGRARPAYIIDFGGTQTFTAPHEITAQCARNCSFTAGEMAGAVALSVTLFVLLAYRARPVTPVWRAAVLALPLLTGLHRIAAGRHFLSDVILSTLLVLLVAALLARVMRHRQGLLTTPATPPIRPSLARKRP